MGGTSQRPASQAYAPSCHRQCPGTQTCCDEGGSPGVSLVAGGSGLSTMAAGGTSGDAAIVVLTGESAPKLAGLHAANAIPSPAIRASRGAALRKIQANGFELMRALDAER